MMYRVYKLQFSYKKKGLILKLTFALAIGLKKLKSFVI